MSKDPYLYERERSDYLEALYQKTLALLDTSKRDNVVDVSAGTGLFCKRFITQKPFRQFVANEPTKNFRKYIGGRFSARSDVRVTGHRAENLGYINYRFHHAVCINSLHKYDDVDKALSELSRVTKRGGTATIVDWDKSGWFLPIYKFLELRHGRRYNACSQTELEKKLKAKGFSIKSSDTWRYKHLKLYAVHAKKET